MIFSELMDAVRILVFSVIVHYIYQVTLVAQGGWLKVLGKGFLFCFIGSAIIASMLGGPTCLDYDPDPMGGECLEYADDGFDPTTDEYLSEFAFYFTISFIPVLLAVNSKRQEEII